MKKKILFITSTYLGDGAMSSGALRWLIDTYPDSEITVACGPAIVGMMRPATNVVRVIPLKKERFNGHWFKLAKQVIGTKWDVVVDIRNSAVSRIVRAKKKIIWGPQSVEQKQMHKVDQVGAFLGVVPTPAPKIWFDEDALTKAEALVPAGTQIIAAGPVARWHGKMWPKEKFIELLQRLTAEDGIMPNARIAIIAAPGEEEIAYDVLNSFPPERRVDVIAKGTPLVAIAAIKRCDMFIGNDSGLMHCAAATGIPTLGLFGPGWPELYGPWGESSAYVSTPETRAELTGYAGFKSETAPCLMTTLTVDVAFEGAVKLWNRVRPASTETNEIQSKAA